jgi:hypothetical protein
VHKVAQAAPSNTYPPLHKLQEVPDVQVLHPVEHGEHDPEDKKYPGPQSVHVKGSLQV